MTTKRYRIPTYKVRLVRDSGAQLVVRGPDDSAAVLRQLCCAQGDRETMVVLYLAATRRLIGAEVIAVGGQSACVTDPPSVYRGAILAGAAAIVLGHNHPSGSTKPSPDDVSMTRSVQAAGKVLGIPLLDHIIVTDDADYSFLDGGKL